MNKFFPLTRLVSFFLIATTFLMPLSSSGKSIGIILSVITILLCSDHRPLLKFALKQPWCSCGFALFLFAIISAFWSPAIMADKVFVIEKYSKLMYLPILAAGFSSNFTRMHAINAFIAAMAVVCLLAIAKFHGFLAFWAVNPDDIFRNHIITSFMAAYASYLAIWQFTETNSLNKKIVYAFAVVAFSYFILAINVGRTGYVVYFILLITLAFQLLDFKKIIAAILMISALFCFAYFVSPTMHQHVNSIQQEIHSFSAADGNKNTSLGYRLQFHSFAQQLFKKHPIIGTGSASFTTIYKNENPVPTWGRRLWEPHSQYWLVLVEFGLLGLGLLLLFFASIAYGIYYLKTMRIAALGIFIPFLLGSFTDSLLFYSGSGYLFLLFISLSFGELIENK